MPTRVTPQQAAGNKRGRAGSNSLSLVSSNSVNDGDSTGRWWSTTPVQQRCLQEPPSTVIDHAADATSRPRLRKNTSGSFLDVDSASFLPSTTAQAHNAELDSPQRRRQLSMQSQKGPVGPRPLDGSKGKRYEYKENMKTLKLHQTSDSCSI